MPHKNNNKGYKKKKDENQKDELEELLEQAEKEAEEREIQEEAEQDKPLSRDEELESYKDQAMRAMADLQNVKKRLELERQDFVKYSSANLLKDLIPVLDNFERAFAGLPDDIKNHEWVNGVSQIEKTFVDVLVKEGLSQISPQKGEDFDPNKHEGIMQDPEEKQGIVSKCLERGYMLKDKVLRPAKVSVGSQE